MEYAPIIIPLLGMALGALTVFGLPWLILHYVTQWRKAGSLSAEDEHMIEDVWRSTRRMERRIEALEAILDAETPGWRKPDGEEGR